MPSQKAAQAQFGFRDKAHEIACFTAESFLTQALNANLFLRHVFTWALQKGRECRRNYVPGNCLDANCGTRRIVIMQTDVEIYDTTLRDGSQGEGINFSVMDKLRIAERLDAFGVHYIEGGWPGSNPKDIEFFELAKRRKFKRARLAAFGSTRRKGVAAAADDQVRLLLEAGTPVVTIFGKTWLLHVKEVLRTTPEENWR